MGSPRLYTDALNQLVVHRTVQLLGRHSKGTPILYCTPSRYSCSVLLRNKVYYAFVCLDRFAWET